MTVYGVWFGRHDDSRNYLEGLFTTTEAAEAELRRLRQVYDGSGHIEAMEVQR